MKMMKELLAIILLCHMVLYTGAQLSNTAQFTLAQGIGITGGTFSGPGLITSEVTDCVASCTQNGLCQTAVYITNTGTCTLFKEYKGLLTLVAEADTLLFSKPSACDSLELYNKPSWNLLPQNTLSQMATPVSYVVVHHTALSRGDNWPTDCGSLVDCQQTLRDIQDYDLNVRGWSDIAPNFFLDASGRVYEGRGWNHKAAYTSVVSHGGIPGYGMHLAVTLFGDFRYQEPSTDAKQALKLFCSCAIEQGYLTKTYTILGHTEDKPSTPHECPGKVMLDVLHNWPLI